MKTAIIFFLFGLFVIPCIAQNTPNNNQTPNNQQQARPAENTQPSQPSQPGQPSHPVFRNMKTFTTNASFQLPKGTTQVMIEAWGAGGGGSNTGGGGGGAYGKTVFAVIDGGTVNVTIGLGGKGGTMMTTPGGNTYVQFRGAMVGATGVTLNVEGGKGAGYIVGMGGAADQGEGGDGASIASGAAGYGMSCGEDGATYVDEYQQSGQNTFIVTRFYGQGGDAGNTVNTGGRGDVAVNPGASNPAYRRNGTPGKVPGGGGGGSYRQIGGYKGADGMVIIYY